MTAYNLRTIWNKQQIRIRTERASYDEVSELVASSVGIFCDSDHSAGSEYMPYRQRRRQTLPRSLSMLLNEWIRERDDWQGLARIQWLPKILQF